jgi:hypothetical protein
MVLFAIFPPWQYQFEFTSDDVSINEFGSSSSYQFNFIFSPPSGDQVTEKSLFQFLTITDNNPQQIWRDINRSRLWERGNINYSVDIERLSIIWITLTLLGAIFYLGLAKRQS